MNKNEFLSRLESLLHGIDSKERSRALSFYSEMIDDFIEEGNTEEEAVEKVGKPGEIAEQLIIEESNKPAKTQSMGKKFLIGLLVVLGSPLWAAFLLVGFCFFIVIMLMIMIMYLMIWLIPFLFGTFTIASLIISVISTLGSFALMTENVALGVTQLGVGVFASGLFSLLFVSTGLIGKNFVVITKQSAQFINKHIIQKVRGIQLWSN